MNGIRITSGHLARHTPKGAGSSGRFASIVDVGQDLLLRELHTQGILQDLVFKGGTALRKLYAGNEGRFSLDIDFSMAHTNASEEDVLDTIEQFIDGLILGPFRYGMMHRRGKRILQIASDEFGASDALMSKLDVSPSPWLNPIVRGWVPMPIHEQYGDPPLPELPVVRLEENLAEKIARLNRATPARDMYDLCWILNNPMRRSELDLSLVRRLAVLKVWVDNYGVAAPGGPEWKPGHDGGPFDPEVWLRTRSSTEFDEEDIGVLAVSPPSLSDLATRVSSGYQFLADLDADEYQVALARGQDRSLVLRMLCDLPGRRLRSLGLY